MSLAAPVIGAAGVRGGSRLGICPAFRAHRRGALWRVVRAVDSRRTRSMKGHGRVTTANADLRRCAQKGGTD